MTDALPASVARRGMRAFLAGTMIAQAAALLRFVILARLLGPEQLGLAAIVILTATFLDLLTEGGMATYLIQSKDGDDPRSQHMVQFANIIRCAGMAIALLLIAEPLARFYDRPELAGGIRMLCFSPMILAFLHYDVKRVQRSHNFGPEGWMMGSSELLSLCASAIIAFLTHSFEAVALGLAGRSLAMVVASHLFAERPYRLGFSADTWKALRTYSWPLVIDGVLYFIGQQGDRLLIGKRLGVEALGYYAALLLLIYYPAAIVNRIIQSINLPLIVEVRDEPERFRERVDVLGGQYLLVGLAMLIGFCATMPVVVPLLYGQRFAVTAYAVALVGLLQSARFLRGWPTTLALSVGRSKQIMINNMLRMLAFPLALAGQALIGGLPGILIGFGAGEVLAFLVSIYLADRSCQRSPTVDLLDTAPFLICGAALCIAGAFAAEHEVLAAGLGWAIGLAAAGYLLWRRGRALDEVMRYGLRFLRRGRAA